MSFNRNLGLSPGDDAASVILETRPEHLAGPEAVHFAVLTTVAEVAAARAVAAAVVPVSVQVSLLTRARPGRLLGRGRVLRRGGRLVFAEGEVTQEERLVAKAQITFALVSP